MAGKINKLQKKHSNSSENWLRRQLNDEFTKQAKKDNYLSRAAYKIIEIINKFNLLSKCEVIIDLGAAPGSWIQACIRLKQEQSRGAKTKRAAKTTNMQTNIINNPVPKIIALDILPIAPQEGALAIEGDFTDSKIRDKLLKILNGEKADLILSDMAANTTGHARTDHIKTLNLCEHAMKFAIENLKPGGNFVVKIFQGGLEQELLANAKKNFTKIKYYKPKASRKESKEMYLVALDRK